MSGGGGMMGGGGGVPQNTNANSMIREGQALNQAMAQNSEASANSAEVAKKKKAAAMAAGTSTDTPENGFIYDSQDSGLSTLPPAAVRRAPVAPRILTAVPRNISATSRS